MRSAIIALGTMLGTTLPALAQIVNGGFETGTLAPWVVTPTEHGHAIVATVSNWDIDGAGPLPVSPAGTFMVGGNAANSGFQGIALLQNVPLPATTRFEMRCNWSVHAFVNVYNQMGGR